MDYNKTLDYLFTRLPMFQRSGPAAYKDNLDNTLKLDELYGHPHRKFKTIHVGGTNGKGSVSHMLASVLQSAGYKVGLYTSPHLVDFRERIRVNGEMIPQQEVVNWIENYRTNNELWKIEPSFFELTVALAFDFFARAEVDIAIIEVGLGGRLDSTNIIRPELSIITNIGYDHVNLLGDTLEKIAGEKAGIIKSETPVIIGTTQAETKSVFQAKASEMNAPLFFADQELKLNFATRALNGKQQLNIEKDGKTVFEGLQLDLLGQYQHKNILAVLKAWEILNEGGIPISEKQLFDGLSSVIKNTGLLGRWQIIGNNPLAICDTGHNEDGIRTIVEQIKQTPHKKLHFVFGTVGDKNPEKVLALLPKNATYYFVEAKIERAMKKNILKNFAADFSLNGETYENVSVGYAAAKENAEPQDLIFVGGSTFVVAEILS